MKCLKKDCLRGWFQIVTLLQINKAINDTLKANLKGTEFENIEFISQDLSEGYTRPCIKVQIESANSGKYNANMKERTLTTRVYFFAKNKEKPKMENIKMQEIIENAFLDNMKVVDDFYIPIDEVESDISDGVLISSFDLETLEIIPDEILDGQEYEPMEELEIKINNEEV